MSRDAPLLFLSLEQQQKRERIADVPFTIEHHEFALDGLLELEVFGRELGRSYCVQWDGWNMAMVEHWFDCDERSTDDLDPCEVQVLERWIRRSRQVARIYEEARDDMRDGHDD